MKKKNLVVIIMTILAVISCKKHKEDSGRVETNTSNFTKTSEYYIDDIAVSEVDFKNKTPNMFLVDVYTTNINTRRLSSEIDTVIEKRAFTSEEMYVAFGKEHGLDFDKQLIFEKIMNEYAQKSGLLTEFDETEGVPNWYLEREKFVYDSLLHNNVNLNSARLNSMIVTLYKDPDRRGSSMAMAKTLAIMPWGWDNKLSSFVIVGLGGALTIYDGNFYGGNHITFLNKGFNTINLSSDWNDKMSSGVLVF